MEFQSITHKLAWPLQEISKQTGLSVPFLRKEIRNGKLKCRKFGARVLVLDQELHRYLQGDDLASYESSFNPVHSLS